MRIHSVSYIILGWQLSSDCVCVSVHLLFMPGKKSTFYSIVHAIKETFLGFCGKISKPMPYTYFKVDKSEEESSTRKLISGLRSPG